MAATDAFDEQYLYDLREWGRRTIFSLMFFCHEDDWLSLPEEQRGDMAHAAADIIVDRCWSEAETECASTPALFERVFARILLKVVAQRISHSQT